MTDFEYPTCRYRNVIFRINQLTKLQPSVSDYRILRVAVWCRGFSGTGPCCGMGMLCVPVSGAARPSGPSGPSAPMRPSRLMLLGALPDAQLWLPTSNFARNSSITHSNIEFTSLELQRFWGISKNDRDKLRANFGWRWCRRRPLRPSALRGSLGALAHCPASP